MPALPRLFDGKRKARRFARCGDAVSRRSPSSHSPRAVRTRRVESWGESASQPISSSRVARPVSDSSRSSAMGAASAASRHRGQRTVAASTGATARHLCAHARIASKLENDTSATIPRRNPSHFAPSMVGNSASHSSPYRLNNCSSRTRRNTCAGSHSGSRARCTCTRMNSARSSRPFSCSQSAYTRRGVSSSMFATMSSRKHWAMLIASPPKPARAAR